jgi:hypothetical protein
MSRISAGRLLPVIVLLSLPAVGAGQARTPGRGEPIDLRLHPSALAQLIDQLGGRQISLPRAKVVSVINPRAFLVESAGPLPATPGNYNRVIVLVEGGMLRVEPLALVGTTVRITGVARTVLGMQVTREVPWPSELTRDIVRRYEVRAAVLSSSVETPDGVQLIAALEQEP